MSDPRISIIMGIYNCAKTLPEAIDSILSQTYQQWKLILCDDGSTDNTFSVAEEYQKNYPEKIVLIRNEKNLGLNYTLNHCLKFADTEYVARMDGDDISLPRRLELEISFLEAHPQYAIVSCPIIYFDEYGDYRTGTDKGEPEKSSLARSVPFCHAPCMVRREAFIAVNGYTVSSRRMRVEDWDLWIKMYEKGYRGFNIDIPLYKMRDDRNASSRRKFKYRINEACVRGSAVYKLGLPLWMYVFTLRPIILGLLPNKLYLFLHKSEKLREIL